jgi:uncharacterized protein YqjF (DUF2071 family)
VPDTEPVTPDAPPLPGRVVVNQDWRDLTWLHWAVDPDRVAPLLPPRTGPDVIDGRTYVGLVPFRMVDLGPGRRGRLHRIGSFLETNVRLYSVDEAGRRGVVFLSLDTDRLLMVPGARAYVGASYRWARMSHSVDANVHEYRCVVRGPGHRGATSHVRVRVGAPRAPSALDHFLTARWTAHTHHLGRTLRVPNRHERWTSHDADLLDLDDRLVAAAGLEGVTDQPPDDVAFSPGVHAEFSWPQIVR